MAENITLASFEFDSSRLEKSIADLQQRLLLLKKEQESYTNQSKVLQKQSEALSAAMVDTARQGGRDSEQYKKLSLELLGVEKAQLEVYKAQQNLNAEASKTRSEYDQTIKTFQSLLGVEGEILSMEAAIAQALDREVTSINAARASNAELLKLRNQLNPAIMSEAAVIEQLNRQYAQNTQYIRENSQAAANQQMSISGYKDSIMEAVNALNPFNGGLTGFIDRANEAGGVGPLVTNSLKSIATGISGITKASLAFIATPIGAVIAGVVASIAAAKEIFDFNKGLQEANKELKALGVNSEELSKVRSEIEATAETFDKEFKDIAAKAGSLADSYGISMSEANNIIAQGLAEGEEMGGNFLESIGQYGDVFANAGYSAQEFVNIVNQGYELGAYADKLPEALMQADTALKQQASTTRDALVNAFGASFSNEVLSGVRTGETTTKQALDAIAKKSKETQLTQQQQAQLTAQLFKSAGEDAGGAMKIFETVTQSANTELSETAKRQLELVEANERLNKAQAELFEIENFGDIWTEIKIICVDALATVFENLAEMKKNLQPVIDLVAISFANAWNALRTTIGVVFDIIKSNFAIITNTIGTFVNFFKALLTGDFSGAIDALKEGFNNLLKIVGNTFAKVKNTLIDGLKGIVRNIGPILDTLGVDVDKLQKKLDGLKSKEVEMKTTKVVKEAPAAKPGKQQEPPAPTGPTEEEVAKWTAARQKNLEDHADKLNKELELYIQAQGEKAKTVEEEVAMAEEVHRRKLAIAEAELNTTKKTENDKLQHQIAVNAATMELNDAKAQAVVKNAEEEAAAFIRNNESQLEDKARLDDKLIAAEIARLNKIDELETAALAARLEQKLITQQEYDQLLLEQTEATEKEKEEITKKHDAQKAADEALAGELKHASDLLKLDTEGWEKFEREQLIADEKHRVESEKLQQQFDDGLISEDNYNKAKANLEEQHSQVIQDIEQRKQQFKLDMAKKVLNDLVAIAGKETAAGKAFAIAQTLIDTYQGAQAAFTGMNEAIPGPVGFAAGVAAAAAVVSAGLSNVKKITATKEPKVKGFATGGIITGGAPVKRANGDDVLITAKRGEAILNKDQQSFIGSQLLSAAGVPGFATGGIVGASSRRIVQNSVINNFNTAELSQQIATAVQEGAAIGTRQGASEGSQMGIIGLSENRQIQNNASY